MSGRRLAWLWLLALVPMLALTWPLRLALDASDLSTLDVSAREATGSIWSGTLRATAVGDTQVGDVSLRLAPLPLLTGVSRLHFAGDGLSGNLLQGRVQGLQGVEGEVVLDPVASMPGLGLLLRFQQADLTFAHGRCRRAGGALTLELRLPGVDDASPGPITLTGPVTCADRTGTVVLTRTDGGAPGTSRVQATLQIEADGAYRLQSLVPAADDPTRLLLQAAGFQDSPNGFSRVDSGALLD